MCEKKNNCVRNKMCEKKKCVRKKINYVRKKLIM